ncbi:MAG TPA: hypothetical protein DIU15_20235 [Deltaproteobacteria bacterium]|nr:hypothetical protein [Deltaproteobacteria bacterium]
MFPTASQPRRLWLLLHFVVGSLMLGSAVSLASAADYEVSIQDLRAPDDLAIQLGIVGSDEAVLGLYWTRALDSVQVGVRRLPLPASGEAGLFVVRELAEGIVPVSVVSGRTSWEGVVRVYRGTVTSLDLDRVLASPEAVEIPVLSDEGDSGFDLFAFYDSLDVLESGRERQEHCVAVAASLADGPDRRLVEQTCSRIKRKNAADDPDSVEEELLDEEGLLTSSLVVTSVEEDSNGRRQGVLYGRDGTRRRSPRGTLARALVMGLGVGGGVAGVIAALKWEERAQAEYVVARASERVGDDVGRSRHLFHTRALDRQRNVAIVVGATAVSCAVVAGVFQQLEQRRLDRAREALKGAPDDG